MNFTSKKAQNLVKHFDIFYVNFFYLFIHLEPNLLTYLVDYQ